MGKGQIAKKEPLPEERPVHSFNNFCLRTLLSPDPGLMIWK